MKKFFVVLLIFFLSSINLFSETLLSEFSFKYIIDLTEPISIDINFLDRWHMPIEFSDNGEKTVSLNESGTENPINTDIDQYYINVTSNYYGNLTMLLYFTPFEGGSNNSIGYVVSAIDTDSYAQEDTITLVVNGTGDTQVTNTIDILHPDKGSIGKTWAIRYSDFDDYSMFSADEYESTVTVEVSIV